MGRVCLMGRSINGLQTSSVGGLGRRGPTLQESTLDECAKPESYGHKGLQEMLYWGWQTQAGEITLPKSEEQRAEVPHSLW